MTTRRPTAQNDEAVADAGIAIPKASAAQSFYSIAQSKSVYRDLLRQRESPTALICGNNIMAHGAISAAMELGIQIPQ